MELKVVEGAGGFLQVTGRTDHPQVWALSTFLGLDEGKAAESGNRRRCK